VRHRVDIAMKADIEKAAGSDRIEDTVDYREIHDIVIRVGRQNSFHLIETLAVRIAQEISSASAATRSASSVQKETPVLDGMVDSVGVEVTLGKEHLSP